MVRTDHLMSRDFHSRIIHACRINHQWARLFRARERHRKKIAGYTTSSITVEVMTPPTIGVAMRFITSAPAPWLQRIGSRPAMMTAAVIALGRTRLTAP